VDLSSLPRPVGFVLGGGGSLGAIQVGMLRALAEHHLVPDLVIGASVGSLNGAALARDPERAVDLLPAVWSSMTRERVFPGGLIGEAITLERTHDHLFPNSGLAEVITEHLGATTTFRDLAVPFAAVTLDVATSSAYVIDRGLLRPALLASAAIPAVFPPVEHDGRLLYDGGVVANVPLREAIARGARSLVVLDCNFPGHVPPVPETLAEIVFFTVLTVMRGQAVLEAPLAAEHVPVVYLPGPAVQQISPLDFDHTDLLVTNAYDATTSFLDRTRVEGPGLYGSPAGP
jgi:NTE family protein